MATHGTPRSPENLEYIRVQEYKLEDFDFYFMNLKKNYAKIRIEEKILKGHHRKKPRKGEASSTATGPHQHHARAFGHHPGQESILQPMSKIGARYRGVLVDRKLGDPRGFPTGFLTMGLHRGRLL